MPSNVSNELFSNDSYSLDLVLELTRVVDSSLLALLMVALLTNILSEASSLLLGSSLYILAPYLATASSSYDLFSSPIVFVSSIFESIFCKVISVAAVISIVLS